MKRQAHLLWLLLAANACAAGALEFCGYIADARTVRFVLAESETGARSAWLGLGQRFQGYTIVEFDRKAETLVVRRDTQTLRLPLQAATIRAEPAAPASGTITVAIGGQDRIVVRDDPMLQPLLETELRRAAALTPPPTVTLRVAEQTPASTLTSVMDLCRLCGLLKISIDTKPGAIVP